MGLELGYQEIASKRWEEGLRYLRQIKVFRERDHWRKEREIINDVFEREIGIVLSNLRACTSE